MASKDPGVPSNPLRRPELCEADAQGAASKRTMKSSDLLAGTNELRIEHNGEVYLLRQTSKGKLILTK